MDSSTRAIRSGALLELCATNSAIWRHIFTKSRSVRCHSIMSSTLHEQEHPPANLSKSLYCQHDSPGGFLLQSSSSSSFGQVNTLELRRMQHLSPGLLCYVCNCFVGGHQATFGTLRIYEPDNPQKNIIVEYNARKWKATIYSRRLPTQLPTLQCLQHTTIRSSG